MFIRRSVLEKLAAISLLILLTGLGACQSTPVKPWDKNILAQPAMQFDATDMDLIMEDHFYFSKEGSSGGRGISAGGCGCN